jgi:hypothetical protein
MVAGIMCLEVLVTTIIAWIGIWGLVDEALENIESKKIRSCVFILIRPAPLNTTSTLALATFAQPTSANQSE